MATRETIEARLNPRRRVAEGEVSLTANGGSVRGTLNKEALRHAGRDPENPGRARWYYLRDKGLLVFDLGGDFDE